MDAKFVSRKLRFTRHPLRASGCRANPDSGCDRLPTERHYHPVQGSSMILGSAANIASAHKVTCTHTPPCSTIASSRANTRSRIVIQKADALRDPGFDVSNLPRRPRMDRFLWELSIFLRSICPLIEHPCVRPFRASRIANHEGADESPEQSPLGRSSTRP